MQKKQHPNSLQTIESIRLKYQKSTANNKVSPADRENDQAASSPVMELPNKQIHSYRTYSKPITPEIQPNLTLRNNHAQLTPLKVRQQNSKPLNEKSRNSERVGKIRRNPRKHQQPQQKPMFYKDLCQPPITFSTWQHQQNRQRRDFAVHTGAEMDRTSFRNHSGQEASRQFKTVPINYPITAGNHKITSGYSHGARMNSKTETSKCFHSHKEESLKCIQKVDNLSHRIKHLLQNEDYPSPKPL